MWGSQRCGGCKEANQRRNLNTFRDSKEQALLRDCPSHTNACHPIWEVEDRKRKECSSWNRDANCYANESSNHYDDYRNLESKPETTRPGGSFCRFFIHEKNKASHSTHEQEVKHRVGSQYYCNGSRSRTCPPGQWME